MQANMLFIDLPLVNEYLVNPNQRLYWVYLCGAGILTMVYWLYHKPSSNKHVKHHDVRHHDVRHHDFRYHDVKNHLRHYWLHPQSILDYKYFVVAWLIKTHLLMPLILSAKTVTTLIFNGLTYVHAPLLLPLPNWTIATIYTLMIFIFGEFSRYWLHRWLHTNPFLWQFHKVHHSATLLNPITFYRVHPLENLLFGLRYALSVGMVTGICLWLFGTQLNIITIFGANALVAMFSLIGGNLRHSHIYLGYPKWLEMWFMSPAQHQLHHSVSCGHKNYGGYLSIFDNWHNTQAFSQDYAPPDIFGLTKKTDKHHRSIGNLLLQPFFDCGAWYAKKQHAKKS